MPTQYSTLPQGFLNGVDQYNCARAQIYKTGGHWGSTSAQEMLRHVARLSSALAKLGVGQGDRVAVFAPNSPEWHVADLAVLGLGAVVVPIYFRESPERIEYIVNHAGAKVVFASGAQEIERLQALRGKLSTVEHVIVVGTPREKAAAAKVNTRGEAGIVPEDTMRYEDILAESPRVEQADVAAYRRQAAAVQPSQLASIIYTSGTTGEPKGVMLSHANFVSNAIASFENFPFGSDDVALSFLPLAHVYERLTDYGFLFGGIPLAYVERPEEVIQALLEVRPTIAAAVPRFFEKFYATIVERGAQAKGFRRRLFDWAMSVARRSIPWKAYGRPISVWTKLQWRLADRLVYKKFRAGVGGRIRIFVSGGAPLSRDLAEFITAVGLTIAQGYGLTETSPVVSNNTVAANHIGTVGHPLRDIEVRIADDGEILVRGPCVMMGYYKHPEETRAVISPDGWFSTGDIGHLDADGYLTITDRKKDLLKTAGGKLVAPAPVENALKTSPYILNAAVVGDKRRFIAALIVPNFAAVEARAAEARLTFKSPADLAVHPWVRQLIESEVSRLTSNLAQYEAIKRFALLDHDFTFDSGELTYTLKLKRRVIELHYATLIEALYAEGAPVSKLPA